MSKYENHEDEWREEENMRRYEQNQARARQAAINRDPFYPPQWAEEEYDAEQ